MNEYPLLRSILMYLDDSPSSAAAVDLGIAWAKRCDALLVGLVVIDEYALYDSRRHESASVSYQAAYNQLLKEARHAAEQRLDSFSQRCIKDDVPYKLLEDAGTPREQLLREAQRYDLVLVGHNVKLGGSRFHPQSDCLSRLLRQAGRPVVAVPSPCAMSGPTLVAYDGSPESARAVQAFLGVGLTGLGDVHVVTLDEESGVRAAKTADRAVEYLRFHEIQATPHALAGPDMVASTTIRETACRLGAGLVVMGACGQSRLTEYLLGSVTRSLLHETGIPLFLVH